MLKKYAEKGLRILGFPSNEFGHQAIGSSSCERDWHHNFMGLSQEERENFPIFDHVYTNGPQMHPVYNFLKWKKFTGICDYGELGWNFVKFLVDGDGKVVKRFAPFTDVTKDAPFPTEFGLDDEGVIKCPQQPILEDYLVKLLE